MLKNMFLKIAVCCFFFILSFLFLSRVPESSSESAAEASRTSSSVWSVFGKV